MSAEDTKLHSEEEHDHAVPEQDVADNSNSVDLNELLSDDEDVEIKPDNEDDNSNASVSSELEQTESSREKEPTNEGAVRSASDDSVTEKNNSESENGGEEQGDSDKQTNSETLDEYIAEQIENGALTEEDAEEFRGLYSNASPALQSLVMSAFSGVKNPEYARNPAQGEGGGGFLSSFFERRAALKAHEQSIGIARDQLQLLKEHLRNEADAQHKATTARGAPEIENAAADMIESDISQHKTETLDKMKVDIDQYRSEFDLHADALMKTSFGIAAASSVPKFEKADERIREALETGNMEEQEYMQLKEKMAQQNQQLMEAFVEDREAHEIMEKMERAQKNITDKTKEMVAYASTQGPEAQQKVEDVVNSLDDWSASKKQQLSKTDAAKEMLKADSDIMQKMRENLEKLNLQSLGNSLQEGIKSLINLFRGGSSPSPG